MRRLRGALLVDNAPTTSDADGMVRRLHHARSLKPYIGGFVLILVGVLVALTFWVRSRTGSRRRARVVVGTAATLPPIDRAVSHAFWEGRAQNADDPRSVTLDGAPATMVVASIGRYQSWLARRLIARGPMPARVVDLGCGNGDWTEWYASFARELLAVDFSRGFVDHVRARLAAIDAKARVEQGDLTTYPIPPDRDLIACGAVTQYLDDAEVAALFARIADALAKDGVFYLRTTISRRGGHRRQTESYQGIYRTQDWYTQQLALAGFTVEARAAATDFIADEIAHSITRNTRVARAFAIPLRVARRIYRSVMATDVLVVLARRDTDDQLQA